jgi:hypothetical protein
MRTTAVAWIAGVTLVLSACGGSGPVATSVNQSPTDAKCSGSSCLDEGLPSPLVCGGVAGATCPQGYHCVDDPADNCDPSTGTDCSGICVLGDDLPRCGGLAGAPCPAGFACADDPSDACTGGPAVDCPGICRPMADGECSADSDCPPLDAPCTVCADGSTSCPLGRCVNGVCLVDFKACPEAGRCGGLSGVSCEPGFHCVDDPTDSCVPDKGGADCGGVCVPDERPSTCGGITGEVCPDGFECVDDLNDGCDPQNGGADCPSHCEPVKGGECKTDADCPALRAPCSVCPDGTAACPRSYCNNGYCSLDFPMCQPPLTCGDDGGGCPPGQICGSDPNAKCDPTTGVSCTGVCVPDGGARPCGGAVGDTCPDGYACVADSSDNCMPDSSGAGCPGVCKPVPASECKADDECVAPAVCSQCADGSYSCAHGQCLNGTCTVAFDACRGPGFCGGIAGFPCAPGFTCVDNPNDDCDPNAGGADCGGMCVREDEPLSCGGLAGKPCPAGYECVDDARDDCDPATGGADCPGICRPTPNPGCTSDAECPAIGAPCRLCADGTAACPRSFCDNGKCNAEFKTCGQEP